MIIVILIFIIGLIISISHLSASSNATNNPTDAAVDQLISSYALIGPENHPKEWNKLRNAWISVNNSPNVSYEKKEELLKFLLKKGLSIPYSQQRIINNSANTEKIKETVKTNPTQENVENYIKHISRVTPINHPDEWNKLKDIWLIIRNSPNVEYNTKVELRDLLIKKGLRLTDKQKEIKQN